MYITYISSAIDYCAAVYLPAMPITIPNKLQILQNSAARVITSCCCDKSVELLNAEANLTPITVKAEIKAACAYHKSLRLPTDNLASDSAMSCVQRTLKSQQSWRRMAKETFDTHSLTNLPRDNHSQSSKTAPWDLINRITMSNQLVTKFSKRDPVTTRNIAATETLKSLPVPVQGWTFGSAVQSVTSGGSGVLIFGKQIDESELPVTSSFISASYRA